MDSVERKYSREIDPGLRAMVVAILVLVIAATLMLPQSGGAHGFDIIAGDQVAIDNIATMPHRLFLWLALVFSVGFSVLALITRRWALAWVALAGSAVASVVGLVAIWSRRTYEKGLPDTHYPNGLPISVGQVICWIAVVLLTFHWLKVVWTRTALQQATDERKRADTELQWRARDQKAPQKRS